LKFELGTMLTEVITFLLLLWFLSRVAWKPLRKMLVDRQQYIEMQIHTTETNRKEAEQLVEEHRALLAEAKNEAHELIEAARRSGERQAAEVLAAAETESKRLRVEALEEITREKEQALAAVSQHVAELTVLLSARVLERQLDEALKHALVAEATKELGKVV